MSEQVNHSFPVPGNAPVYIGRQEFVIEYAAGKDVLHLGCVDEGMIEKKQERGLWLHERLSQVAKSVWGIDIDEKGIDRMRTQGYPNLYLADLEDINSVPGIDLHEFDLILLTEVLEHLNNPGKFLGNLKPIFRPGTEMLVTVPNATSLANILANLKGTESVHPDHNYWFSLHTLTALFNKFGYCVTWVGVYCQHNYRRSITRHLWHRILRTMGIKSAGKEVFIQPGENLHPENVKKPNPKAWLSATLITLSYRALINKNPFFADGLMIIVKPVDQNHH